MKDTVKIGIRGKKACDAFVATIKEEAKEMKIETKVAMLVSGMIPLFNEKGKRVTDYETMFKELNMPKSIAACKMLVKEMYLEVLEEDTTSLLEEMV